MVERTPAGDAYRLGPELLLLAGRARRCARPARRRAGRARGARPRHARDGDARGAGRARDAHPGRGDGRPHGGRAAVARHQLARARDLHRQGAAGAPARASAATPCCRGSWPVLTPRTVTDAAALDRALARVRTQGFAIAQEELEQGFVAVAAPVRDASGAVVAALSVGGPKARLPAAALQSCARRVAAAAQKVSTKSGPCRPGRAGTPGPHRKEVPMKTHDVLVLGGGMIGSAVAFDLARTGRARVTIADLREPALPLLRGRADVAVRRADLSDPGAVRDAGEGFDVVVGAPAERPRPRGAAGGASRRAPTAWTSASSRRTRSDLDGLARERGVTAVVDCGVAPGISNLMVGYAAAQLDAGGRRRDHGGRAAARAALAVRLQGRRSRPPT